MELNKIPLVVTCGVHEKMAEDAGFYTFIMKSLRRYFHHDWGEMCNDDKKMNDHALGREERIFAAYKNDDCKIYIITEADRSHTTILFPNEY